MLASCNSVPFRQCRNIRAVDGLGLLGHATDSRPCLPFGLIGR